MIIENEELLFLPRPRQITFYKDSCSLLSGRLIVLNSPQPQALGLAASRLQQALRSAGIHWAITASASVPEEEIGAVFNVVPGSVPHQQGYQIHISTRSITILTSTPAGAFYAAMTLCQILEQSQQQIPTLSIQDWPDFLQRGVMLDVSRDKVPTLATLFDLVDLLAGWKINQLQLYTEHTFAYRNHPEVWAEASPLTGEDILALDAYCRERFIELVPNQNSFGHMHRWLIQARYRPLAECPQGCDTPLGFFEEPFSLCPLDPGSLELIRGLYDELLPHFSSRLFNAGCDETFDLGYGRSREAAEERGLGRVYLDYLLKIYREIKQRGFTMQFWADIILNHPELVGELPGDMIALEWGYEAEHPFGERCASFAAAGLPFYVCPGTSSWNSIAGRSQNALENLRKAAENGLNYGAVGYLITDWGDNGHWQPLPVSYLGFLFGAAVSWAYQANLNLYVPAALSQFAFKDRSGEMGRLAMDLGNVYQETGVLLPNSSVLFQILQTPLQEIQEFPGIDIFRLQRALEAIDAIMAGLRNASIKKPDAEYVTREYSWAADMLRHACHRGILALGGPTPLSPQALADQAGRLGEEFQAIWHLRNRPGGFRDSLARMERLRLVD